MNIENNFQISSNFDEYMRCFLEENSKHNLISKNDEKLLYEKHIYDSLALKLFLNKYNITSGNILDIGCGGGFPCVPLAIELKDFYITGIDSIRKKIESVRTIKDKLCLANLELICDRVENIDKKYDIVVTRAVADMAKVCDYALPHVIENGYFVAYKSKRVSDELEGAKKVLNKYNANVVDIIEYHLSTEEVYERNLVIVRYESAN